MLLICLFLIALIAVAVVTEKESLASDETELVSIPVKVNETRNYR